MQIMIDIPDKYISIDTSVKEWIDEAGNDCKVRLLPEGHGDLIDRNEAKKIADEMFEHITSPLLNHIQTYDVYSLLEATPTIIEADKIGSEVKK